MHHTTLYVPLLTWWQQLKDAETWWNSNLTTKAAACDNIFFKIFAISVFVDQYQKVSLSPIQMQFTPKMNAPALSP